MQETYANPLSIQRPIESQPSRYLRKRTDESSKGSVKNLTGKFKADKDKSSKSSQRSQGGGVLTQIYTKKDENRLLPTAVSLPQK
jgi:hypothetical protein